NKRKQDRIDGINLWEIEIAFYTNKRGIDPEKARTFTILRWMYLGDFRPLAAAIDEGHVLDFAVLNCLAGLILDGRLKLTPSKGRGHPKAPETFARSVVSSLAYEHRRQSGEPRLGPILPARPDPHWSLPAMDWKTVPATTRSTRNYIIL